MSRSSDEEILRGFVATYARRRRPAGAFLAIFGVAWMLLAGWQTIKTIENAEILDTILEFTAKNAPAKVPELNLHKVSSLVALNLSLSVASGLAGLASCVAGLLLFFGTPTRRIVEVLARRAASAN